MPVNKDASKQDIICIYQPVDELLNVNSPFLYQYGSREKYSIYCSTDFVILRHYSHQPYFERVMRSLPTSPLPWGFSHFSARYLGTCTYKSTCTVYKTQFCACNYLHNIHTHNIHTIIWCTSNAKWCKNQTHNQISVQVTNKPNSKQLRTAVSIRCHIIVISTYTSQSVTQWFIVT